MKVELSISSKMIKIGIKIAWAVIYDISNNKINSRFITKKNRAIDELSQVISPEVIKKDFILQGYRDLHDKVGRSNRKYTSAPESLLNYFLRTKSIPTINPVVDIYNLISLNSKLAIGAHDVAKLKGGVNLKFTAGSESFTPLGSQKTKIIPMGEYAYIDDSNRVICRLECQQSDITKISPTSSQILFIVQGNDNTTHELVNTTLLKLVDDIKDFCEGRVVELKLSI